MSLHVNSTLLCSAERSALRRRIEQRRHIVNVIILSLLVTAIGVFIGWATAMSDVPHGAGLLAMVLWMIWAARFLFRR